ncbi:Uncharacterised protein [Streptococcus pneumoniae]|nr:Uncharacterised protein [Streptococcus pneumoniae]CGF54985.1 Uncharacterised protein [Streptococcus pneumoniae]CIV80128.1 Uncharacterised protein [Streptococcus pneumoniae]CJG21484.1 Uncharacterised protein [Streptococcus pneumoniae]COP48866.1 Uncharacterised protein [Streptococcus pneumoniae]
MLESTKNNVTPPNTIGNIKIGLGSGSPTNTCELFSTLITPLTANPITKLETKITGETPNHCFLLCKN